jgi:hypothetical protein
VYLKFIFMPGAILIALLAVVLIPALLLNNDSPSLSEERSPESSEPDLYGPSRRPAESFVSPDLLAIVGHPTKSWIRLHHGITKLDEKQKKELEVLLITNLTCAKKDGVNLINLVKLAGLVRTFDQALVTRLRKLAMSTRKTESTCAVLSLGMLFPDEAEVHCKSYYSDGDYRSRVLFCEAAPFFRGEWQWFWTVWGLDDASEDVCLAALKSLLFTKKSTPKARETVAHLARGRTPWRVRALCLKAIGEWKVAEGLDVLTTAARDSNHNIRLSAANGLAGFSSPEAHKALFLLIEDQNQDVRRMALASWSSTGTPKQAESIARYLSDNDEVFRRGVVKSLAKVAPAVLLKSLSRIRMDASPKVRLAFVKGIAKLDGEEAFDALLVAMEDRDEAVAREAMDGLSKREAGTVLPSLIAKLESSNPTFPNTVALLGRVAGVTVGEGPSCPPMRRSRTVILWREWWNINRKKYGK